MGRTSTGKRTATILCVLGLGGALLLGAGFIYRNQLIDSWYIRRLDSESFEDAKAAAMRLLERRSVRAIPALVRQLASFRRRQLSLFEILEARGFREVLVSGIAKLVPYDSRGSCLAFHSLLRDGSADLHPIVFEILLPVREAVEPEDLIPWLADTEGRALHLACYLLYSSGPIAIPSLEAAARGHADPRVRRNAADLLEALREEEGLPSGGAAPAVAPAPGIVFSGQEYDGVFLCCDKSGSMKEHGKWQKVQEELARHIEGLGEGAQFGIAFFEFSLSAFPAKSRRPVRANPALKAAAQGFVFAGQAGGPSCALPALVRCVELANNSTARSNCILLFTDENPSCLRRIDPVVYQQQIIEEVSEMNTRRVPVHAILLGLQGGPAEAWLRELTSRNGGSYQTRSP